MARNPIADREQPEEDERIMRQPAAGQHSPSSQDRGERQETSPDASTYISAQSANGGRGEIDPGRTPDLAVMSEREMEEFLRNEFINQVLPSCPDIPGFHTCWLSTTNQYDTIPYRMRLGYTPVRLEEAPQFRSTSVKTGDYAGMIGVNEMLLFKIPESAYQKIMRIFHHDRPNDEEERLRANIALMESGELSKGRQMVAELGDGTEEMLKRNPARAPERWQ